MKKIILATVAALALVAAPAPAHADEIGDMLRAMLKKSQAELAASLAQTGQVNQHVEAIQSISKSATRSVPVYSPGMGSQIGGPIGSYDALTPAIGKRASCAVYYNGCWR